MLRKNTRLILLITAIIILAAAGYGLFRTITPDIISENTEQYSYTVAADSSYEVALIDNELFLEKVLGEGRLYARSLIDTLNINFTADYSGNKAATVRGEYSIDVSVQAYQLIGETRMIVYERLFPVVTRTQLQGDTSLQISKTVAIDLNTYKAFAENAELILNAKPSRDALVIFSGSFVMLSEYGEVNEPFYYTIQLPLTNDLFAITKAAPFAKNDVLTETRQMEQVAAPIDFALPVSGIILGLALMSMLFFFSRLPTVEEQYAADFKTIQRKYGNRLARLSRLPTIAKDKRVEVATLESLIKIADERKQTIYYSLDEGGLPANGLLYVSDEDKYYALNLQGNILL